MKFLKKLYKMLENIEILKKEEEIVWFQNQIIILQSISHKIF